MDMSDFEPNRSPDDLTEREDNAKTHAVIAYIFMLLGFFTVIFWLIGAIWAMVKVSDAGGTLFEDHYRNIIKTFWWGIAWSIAGLLLTFFLVGYLLLFIVWVWSIYRMVRGVARATSNQSYYFHPTS